MAPVHFKPTKVSLTRWLCAAKLIRWIQPLIPPLCSVRQRKKPPRMLGLYRDFLPGGGRLTRRETCDDALAVRR